MDKLTQEVDFVYLDNSQYCGLTTNAIFLPNREGLKTSLEIVEKEYYKSKDIGEFKQSADSE